MADPRFIHLRVHSDFSMVDGLQKIGPIVSAAAANNMPALALTDQMNMCGLVRFYGSAHGKGIKPLVGADFWVQSDELGDEQFRLTLLAMDNDGYQNITLLISRGYQRGHVQGRPVIDKGWLVEHAKGVIVLSGGREGDLGKFLLKGNRQMVEQSLAFYRTHFPDAYYLELLRTGRPDEEVYLHMAALIAPRDKQGDVLVAVVVHGQQGEAKLLVAELIALHPEIRPDQGLDPLAMGRAIEAHQAAHVHLVGQGQGRHVVGRGCRDDGANLLQAIDHGEVGVDPQVDEARIGHGYSIPSARRTGLKLCRYSGKGPRSANMARCSAVG